MSDLLRAKQQAEIAARIAKAKAKRNQERAYRNSRPLTEAEKRDRAVLSVMKDYPLQPGQMLLLGPESVRLLSTPGAFAGSLPDKIVLDKSDWSVVK